MRKSFYLVLLLFTVNLYASNRESFPIVVGDTIPPAIPILVSAKASLTEYAVDIEWVKNSEPDLASYNLYRNTSGDSATASNIATPIKFDSLYHDNSGLYQRTFYYWLAAVDSSGNESPRLAFSVDVMLLLEQDFAFGELGRNLADGDVAWADYDGDGDLDLVQTGRSQNMYFGSEDSETNLYRNDNGTLNRIQLSKGFSKSSVDWGDYDLDGDLDILISGIFEQGGGGPQKTGGPQTNGDVCSFIYQNEGSDTFIEKELNLEPIYNGSSKFADFNNDGYLDIFLIGADSNNVPTAKLYFNDKAGNYIEQASSFVGLEYADASISDVDNDGDLDIIVNGRDNTSTSRTSLYVNTNGSFSVASATFTGLHLGSIEFGDYNGDKLVDVLQTGTNNQDNKDYFTELYTNMGGLSFSSAIPLDSVFNGEARFADMDNDGDLDIVLIGTSYFVSRSSRVDEFVFRLHENNSGSFLAGKTFNQNYEALTAAYLAWGDYTNDGAIDLFVNGERIGGEALGKNGNKNKNSSPFYDSQTYVFQNTSLVKNTNPSAPSSPSELINGVNATLQWSGGSDTESSRLTYNVFLERSNSQHRNPVHSDSSGYRQVVANGNAGFLSSYTIKNLEEGYYNWAVQSVDDAKAASPFTLVKRFKIDTTPPDTPMNLMAVAGENEIHLSWSANSESDFAAYELYDVTGSQALVTSINHKDSTSYTVSSLINDQSYSYQILAVDSSGNKSALSLSASAIPRDTTPPAVPVNLHSTAFGHQYVGLAWSPNSDSDLAAYYIYQGLSPNPTTRVDSTFLADTTITISGLTNDQEYYFRITARDSSGNESDFSIEISETPTNHKPYVFQAIADITENEDFAKITFSWEDVFRDTETSPEDFVFSFSGASIVTIAQNGPDAEISSISNIFGTDTLYFTVMDEAAQSVTDTVLITVNPVNDAPYIESAISDQNLTEDFSSYTINLENVFADQESADSLLAYTVSGENLVQVSIASGIATISSITNLNGLDTLYFIANDDSLASVTDTVLFAINSEDDAPVRVNPLADIELDEDASEIRVDLTTVFSDLDGSFSLALEAFESELFTASIQNDSLRIHPNVDKYGEETLIITASSLGKVLSLSASDTIQVKINPIVDSVSFNNLSVGDSELTVNWNASSEADVANYRLYYGSGGDFASVSDSLTIAHPTLSSTISSLTNGTNYIFFLRVFDDAGHFSALSQSIMGSPQDMTPPSIPLNLVGSDGDQSVFLDWADNSESDFASYYIYQIDGESQTVLDTVNQSEATISNLSNGTSYNFRVSAVDANGNESELSNLVTITPMGLNISSYVFQNQILDNHLHVVLNTNLKLINAPNTQLSSSSADHGISMSQVDSLTYRGSFEIPPDESGNFTLLMSAFANNDRSSSVSLEFSIGTVSKAKTSVIASLDETANLEIAANSFDQDIRVLHEIDTEMKSYRFSSNKKAKKDMKLNLNFNRSDYIDIGKLFVYKRDGDDWIALETQIYPKESKATVFTDEFGEFRLVYDASFEGSNLVPEYFSLEQNYPNPFNPSTTIRFNLPQDQRVKLLIYNSLGQKVRTLLDAFVKAGQNQAFTWNGRNDSNQQVASGIYFYQVITSQKVLTKKMILLK